MIKKINKRAASNLCYGIFALFIAFFMFGFSFSIGHKLLTYVDTTGHVQPVKTKAEWQIKRNQILDSMQVVMGSLPDRSQLPPLDIRYLDSIKRGNYVRYTIEFTVATNEIVPAYLYVPIQKGAAKKLPAMLALHSTGALGKGIVDGQSSLSNRAYAKEFAERGYVVIAPDYPGFGGLKNYNFETDRYASTTMKNIFDDMRCVNLLQARPDVDPDRIGVIGHSLGGHAAIFVGAFDKRLKVVVSSCGWTLFDYYFNGDTAAAKENGGKLWPWAQEKYMPLMRTKYHLDPDKVPFDFDEVIAAIAPRAFFSNSPLYDANFNVNGVKKGIEKISKVYRFLGAEDMIEVCYPPSKHDFPHKVRYKSYQFIDSIFNVKYKPYSYLDNLNYKKRRKEFAKDTGARKIVMLGNSLTERCNWKKLLEREDVANRGIGSDITEGYIHRINEVFELKPQVCFIEGGVNDLARHVPKKRIIRNLATLIDTLRLKEITPVLGTTNFVAENYQYITPKVFNLEIRALNAGIKDLAKKKDVFLIDLNPLLTDGQFALKKYVIKDGIHYNSKAYSLWKVEIEKILAKLNLDK